MNSPPLPANWADLPDDKLGEELLRCWSGYQVATKDICEVDTATDTAEKILSGTLLMYTDVAKDIPLEKALQRAASGDFTGAGTLLRDLLQDSAIVMLLEKWGQTGLKFRLNQSNNAKKLRNRIKVDGEKFSIASIVQKFSLRTDELGDYIPARDLWVELFSELDERHLEPKEKREVITYIKDDDGICNEIKYTSFEAMISKARKS